MTAYPSIQVRHPQPHDIVNLPLAISGIATGYEATIAARVRDFNGKKLAETPVQAGGNGIQGEFRKTLTLSPAPTTTLGTLEVYEPSAENDTDEHHKVSVIIAFGPVLLTGYFGFLQHTVQVGETLSGIAKQHYDDSSQWRRLFDANRHILINPDRISVGQVLRVPQ